MIGDLFLGALLGTVFTWIFTRCREASLERERIIMLSMIARRLNEIPTFYRRLLTQLCQQMVEVLQRETPGTVFPTLWKYEITRDGQHMIAHIWNTRLGSEQKQGSDPDFERIAFYLDLGTSRHMVAPVVAQALHWVVDGEHFFSKGHMVSGISPSHFRQKADRVLAEFNQTISTQFAAYMEHGRLP